MLQQHAATHAVVLATVVAKVVDPAVDADSKCLSCVFLSSRCQNFVFASADDLVAVLQLAAVHHLAVEVPVAEAVKLHAVHQLAVDLHVAEAAKLLAVHHLAVETAVLLLAVLPSVAVATS